MFDGPTQPSKWATKIKRMRNQSEDIVNNQMYKVHYCQQEGSHSSHTHSHTHSRTHSHTHSRTHIPPPPSVASVPPVLGLQAIIQVMKYHERTMGGNYMRVYQASDEADEEVVRIAVQYEAVAIMSNDSDMLFFHTQQRSHSDKKHHDVPVSVPLLPFSSFQMVQGGGRLVMDALIHRQSVAKAMGVRSEVQFFIKHWLTSII